MIKVVTVIPISRGISKDTLTYFSATELSLGAIVDVPLRSKVVPALVIDIAPAEQSKQDLKKQSWNLKKIESKRHDQFFTSAFMEAVTRASDYFATTKGSVLSGLIPRDVFEQKTIPAVPKTQPRRGVIREELFVLQDSVDERLSHHRSLIREEFAKGSSVFFLFPTTEAMRHMTEALKKGIERYTHVLHADLPPKEILRVWSSALTEAHPVLILGTAPFLSLPRPDIGTYVVEHEGSRFYKMQARPHLDYRTFVEFLADAVDSRLIFADTMLRTETIWRYKEGDLIELSPLKFRIPGSMTSSVVDMRIAREEGKEPTFAMLSPELIERITEARQKKERLFILAARRGYAPTTSCGDCGDMVLCASCHAPVVLHGKTGSASNFFLCHKCGERRPPDTHCARCGSWKLTTLGIGTEGVEREVKRRFPDIVLFRLDADTAKTPKKAHEITKAFLGHQGSVLIGTEMALSYLEGAEVAETAIASIDALFSIPDFRINERILRMLLATRALATRHFLIQSRTDQNGVLRYALQGNLIDFYREEIAERKNFGYPPFSTLIKISLTGEKEKVRKEVHALGETLEKYNAASFPDLTDAKKGAYTMHTVIKLDRKLWIDRALLDILRSLPPQYDIAVDPETLL